MQKKKVRNWKSIGSTIAVILAFGIVIFACIYSIIERSNAEQQANVNFSQIEETVTTPRIRLPHPVICSAEDEDNGDVTADTDIQNMNSRNTISLTLSRNSSI